MVGSQAARAIAGTLVEEIINAGLYAEPAQESPPFPDNVVLIKGQILSIDEGNRTIRTLIGLGAGRTAIEADAQVLYLAQGAGANFGIEPGAREDTICTTGRRPRFCPTKHIGRGLVLLVAGLFFYP